MSTGEIVLLMVQGVAFVAMIAFCWVHFASLTRQLHRLSYRVTIIDERLASNRPAQNQPSAPTPADRGGSRANDEQGAGNRGVPNQGWQNQSRQAQVPRTQASRQVNEQMETARPETVDPNAGSADRPPIRETAIPVVESPAHAAKPKNAVELFNEDPSAFMQQFSPKRFGILNSGEMRKNATAQPIYGPVAEGDFWLFEEGNGAFVVPQAPQVFQTAHYKAEIFDCDGYEGGKRYKGVQLIKPARFRQMGDQWKLDSKGSLRLSQPEPEQ